MNPIKFKGHNAVLAEDQPEYLSLPVCVEHDGRGAMVSCYQLTIKERIKLLFKGRIYFRQLTFGSGFQPIQPMLDWKDQNCRNCGAPIGDHKAATKFKCPHLLAQDN